MSERRDGFWVPVSNGQRFFYTLAIDDNGFKTLRWLAARGYDCGLEEALEQHAECLPGEYVVPEYKVWDIAELANDEDGDGFACLDWNSEIGQEIRRFLDSVV